jgi:hypothetical protein
MMLSAKNTTGTHTMLISIPRNTDADCATLGV